MPHNVVSMAEIIKECALDTLLYGKIFLPNTFSAKSPEFHREIVEVMEMPGRFKAVKVARGHAKTSLARAIVSKRIAYAESKVILFTSKSQDHAIKSILWIKHQVTHNKKWADTFGISKAMDKDSKRPKKWTDEWITIYNSVAKCEIHIIAYGITGQIRGVNINDARPDFILGDDIIDDENAGTKEQREKIKKLVTGALLKSLVPRKADPNAMALFLQTPCHKDDFIESIMNDPMWITRDFSCFVYDAKGKPIASIWPDWFDFDDLIAEKNMHIRTHQLSVWYREMEVKITASELQLGKPDWIYNSMYEVLPEKPMYILSADPTPPPKEGSTQTQVDLDKLDDAVIMIQAMYKGHFYLVEYYTCKSPLTAEFATKFVEYYIRYRPTFSGVETILFARSVKEAITNEQHAKGIYFLVVPVEDKRKKFTRIKDTVYDLAMKGKYHVKAEHTEFIAQYLDYPQVEHDDLLDGASIGIMIVNPAMLHASSVIEGEYEVMSEDDYEDLDFGGYLR